MEDVTQHNDSGRGEGLGRPKGVDRRKLVGRIGDLVKEGKFDGIYRQTMEKIREETDFFDVFEELGLWDEILEGKFGREEEIDFNAPIDTAGLYRPDTGAKLVAGAPVSREAILISIASRGDVPTRLDTAAHEEIHDLQYPDNPFFSRIYQHLMTWAEDRVLPGREWMEVVAYRLTFPEIHEGGVGHLVEHLVKPDSGYDQMDRVQVVAAVQLVDQLRALGAGVKEICSLGTESGGWDEKTRSYPAICEEVRQRCESRGVEYAGGLSREVEMFRRRKLADQIRAQEIAVKEIGLGQNRY